MRQRRQNDIRHSKKQTPTVIEVLQVQPGKTLGRGSGIVHAACKVYHSHVSERDRSGLKWHLSQCLYL